MSTGTNKERILQNNSLVNNNNTKISNISVKVNKLSGLSKTEYDACLEIADSIEIGVDYSGTTATANDIVEGKIAYANGERLVGTLKENTSNATVGSTIGAGSNVYSGITRIIEKVDGPITAGSDGTKAFYLCNTLKEIPKNLNTKNTTKFTYMFSGCESLTEAYQTETSLQTPKAKVITGMFQSCGKLVTVGDFDFPELQTMNDVFKYSGALKTIGKWNVPKVIDCRDMFWNNTGLANLGGFIDLGKGYTYAQTNYTQYTLDLTTTQYLTYESLMNVINGLYDLNLSYDVANGGTLYTQSLKITSNAKALLSEADIAIATAKGWTIV